MAEVLVGAERRVHLIEVLHRITAVIIGMGHLEQRHQMQIGNPLLGEVIQFLFQMFEVSGEQVGVHGDAQHLP